MNSSSRDNRISASVRRSVPVTRRVRDAPIFFFSRQIGLANGQTVPIAGGGRLMGRVGAFNVGAMTIRTKDAPEAAAAATTFSVVRVRRDFLRRSSIGLIATDRRPAATHDFNQVFGIDAGLRFFQNLEVNSYYARSRTASVEGDEAAYSGNVRYAGDLYGLDLGRVSVGAQFNPELGFLTRRGFGRTFASARFSRRPRELLDDSEGRLGGGDRRYREHGGRSANAACDRDLPDHGRQWRPVQSRLHPQRGPSVGAVQSCRRQHPAGDLRFGDVRLTYTLGAKRPVVGMVSFATGDYYGGEKTEGSFNGRVPISARFSLEPILTLDLARDATRAVPRTSRQHPDDLHGDAADAALGARAVQLDGDSLGTNARFRWEYRPGSDLYVVYTDGRDTAVGGFPGLLNRSFAIKLSRLLQF